MESWLSSVDGISSTHRLDTNVVQEEGESEACYRVILEYL